MRKALLGVVLLVLVAGCTSAVQPPGAVPADGQATGIGDEPHIAVTNGSIPVDETALFFETTRMLGADVSPPETIEIEREEDMAIQREPMPHFFQIVGVDRPAGANSAATALGYVTDPSTVHVNERLADDSDQLRLTLTHEYVHVVQKRTDAVSRLEASVPDQNTTDADIVRTSVLEGVAVTVETRYWERHAYTGTSPAAGMKQSYAATEGARQWVYAPYYLGYEYVQTRTASPTATDALYDEPPHTSEELVHGLPGGSEPLPPLSVDVQSADWAVNGTDRTGELFVRVALDTELGSEEAATAAAGWGTDNRVALTNGDDRAYAWALRWDDAANATEFERAVERYLDARGTADGEVWVDGAVAFDVTRVGDETVVVLLGDESFVRTATVRGTDGTVTVAT